MTYADDEHENSFISRLERGLVNTFVAGLFVALPAIGFYTMKKQCDSLQKSEPKQVETSAGYSYHR